MRIGMLLMGGTYPPDIRVEKEARVLQRTGHEIFLLTSDKDGGPTEERIGPLAVARYPHRGGRVRSKAEAAVTLTTWRNLGWKRAIARFVQEERIDALHVHDLPAVKVAVEVARTEGIPVVFDMHENYPAAVTFWDRPLSARLAQTPERYRAYERWAVNAADRVVCVVDESAQRVREMGAASEAVVVFGNVDDCEAEATWKGPEGPLTIAYAGGFGPHRGIDVLVRAFARVRAANPDAHLVLMGAGVGESELRELVVALRLRGAVEFTGWVDEQTMRSRLAEASVGVVPHLRNEHTDSTVPHKLFQYMCIGLPVVVTDCAPLKRIVDETGAGRVARAGDDGSLAEEILSLADPAAAQKASDAGRSAVKERYSLKAEGSKLVEMYDGLAVAAGADG
jgi:glycosyltransferase involved in cell wall biosynthesis